MLIAAAAPLWMSAKAAWSGLNDGIMATAPRQDVATRTPEDAAALLRTAAPAGTNWPTPYRGDPVWGLFDFYTHPRRLEAALTAPDPRAACAQLYIDCDDIAVWAWATTRHLGSVATYTLLDAGLTGSHVICVGTRLDGSHWAIDTNGLRALEDRSPAALCRLWSEMYQSMGFRYVDAQLSVVPQGW